MYQTVGSEFVELIGKCFNKPLYVYDTLCLSANQNLEYNPTDNDEVEELYFALKDIFLKNIEFEGFSSGAILSTYQKNRVENICNRLHLHSMSPLWNCNQKELLNEMIEYGIDARIIKIASPIFNKKFLNMSLKQIFDFMNQISTPYELNFCGEGGEYESIVLDCPHFKYKIVMDEYECISHPEELDKDESVFYIYGSKILLNIK